MSETYRSGAASVTVDQDRLVDLLDRTSEGAASRFITASGGVLDRIREDAQAEWPVRTGRSLEAFRVETRINEDAIRVVLLNDARSGRWGAYAYKIKWSIRTKSSLDAEADRAAARGTTSGARSSIRKYWRRRLTRAHGEGAPSARRAGQRPWIVLVRRPSKAKKTTGPLIDRLRADLALLARGG